MVGDGAVQMDAGRPLHAREAAAENMFIIVQAGETMSGILLFYKRSQ